MNYKKVKDVILAAAEIIEDKNVHASEVEHRVNNLLLAVEADVAPIDEISDDALASKEIERITIELKEYINTLKM